MKHHHTPRLLMLLYRCFRAVDLLLFFCYELLVSSLRVMWDIVTPGQNSLPAFIAMPLTAKTDAEIFFTANLISLTPGTLSMDVSPDRSTLYVHVMYMDDVPSTLLALKKFESRVLKVF